MLATLILLALFSFGFALLSPLLGDWQVFNLPLGYFMAANGSVVVFIGLAFWFCRHQERTDTTFGFKDHEYDEKDWH
ncbi:DUF4212 domain-containing protein [Rhodobacteraceae bacterium RKSG542]|nr:DUF4212 domain-containing protein [Pseudovibrio flavus]